MSTAAEMLRSRSAPEAGSIRFETLYQSIAEAASLRVSVNPKKRPSSPGMDQTVQNGANDPALEAAAYRRLYPRKYLSRFLQENQRSDGRSIDAWRNVAINVGE